MSKIVRGLTMCVEPNQTKELFELMYDIRDRTTRIEAETSRLNIIEKKSDRATSTASEALLMSNANEKEIEKVDNRIDRTENNIKWLWTTAITLLLGIAGIIVSVVI